MLKYYTKQTAITEDYMLEEEKTVIQFIPNDGNAQKEIRLREIVQPKLKIVIISWHVVPILNEFSFFCRV